MAGLAFYCTGRTICEGRRKRARHPLSSNAEKRGNRERPRRKGARRHRNIPGNAMVAAMERLSFASADWSLFQAGKPAGPFPTLDPVADLAGGAVC